jgi:RHS repeat-associated protein
MLGRFVSADSVVPGADTLTIGPAVKGGGPANPQDLNRYSYVNNNPIARTDPTGHDWEYFKQYALGMLDGVISASNSSNPVFVGYHALQSSVEFANDPSAYIHRRVDPLVRGFKYAWNDPSEAWETIKSSPREIGQIAGSALVAAVGAKAAGSSFSADTPPANGTVPETVSLYRAVGRSELNDLLRFGDYGLSPSGSGKYFALTEQGVQQFADSSWNIGRNLTLTKIEVPKGILNYGYQFFDPGGGGASIHFADGALPLLYKVAGLPEIISAPWVPHFP